MGHVFLYKMFDEQIIGSYGYPLWFISTITQFYLSFIGLAKVLDKDRGFVFVLGSLFVSILWAGVVVFLGKEEMRVWNSFFLQYLWEFSLGMFLAKRYFTKGEEFWKIKSWILMAMMVIGIGLYAVLALEGGPAGKIFNDVPALMGYTSIAILGYTFLGTWIRNFISWTSGFSYSLYLVHALILNLGTYFLTKVGWQTNGFILIILLGVMYLVSIPVEMQTKKLTGFLLSRRVNNQ